MNRIFLIQHLANLCHVLSTKLTTRIKPTTVLCCDEMYKFLFKLDESSGRLFDALSVNSACWISFNQAASDQRLSKISFSLEPNMCLESYFLLYCVHMCPQKQVSHQKSGSWAATVCHTSSHQFLLVGKCQPRLDSRCKSQSCAFGVEGNEQ